MAEERDRGVLTHMYRGELSRMIAYRVRLDTTTNWAIGLSAAIVSFGLSHSEIPHAVMLLAVLIDLQLLYLEARRYRAFDLSRRRVRLLETGFLAEVLGGGADWVRALERSYTDPRWQISAARAAGHRIRRNYLWLVASVLSVWVFKVRFLGEGSVVDSARIGLVHGAVVLTAAASILVALVVLAARAPVEDPA